MPAFSDPARRSGAAKSKEEAEGQKACGATRNGAGGTTGEAHATEHIGAYTGSAGPVQAAVVAGVGQAVAAGRRLVGIVGVLRDLQQALLLVVPRQEAKYSHCV